MKGKPENTRGKGEEQQEPAKSGKVTHRQRERERRGNEGKPGEEERVTGNESTAIPYTLLLSL